MGNAFITSSPCLEAVEDNGWCHTHQPQARLLELGRLCGYPQVWVSESIGIHGSASGWLGYCSHVSSRLIQRDLARMQGMIDRVEVLIQYPHTEPTDDLTPPPPVSSQPDNGMSLQVASTVSSDAWDSVSDEDFAS